MEYTQKEVYFSVYCPSCKYTDLHGDEHPCDECLDHSFNEHSHKPVKYEEKL